MKTSRILLPACLALVLLCGTVRGQVILSSGTGSCYGTGGGTLTGLNTTGANLIVAAVVCNSSGSATTVSDSKLNTWNPLPFVGSTSSGTPGVQIWYTYPTNVGSSHTISNSTAYTSAYTWMGVMSFNFGGTTPRLQTVVGYSDTAGTLGGINTATISTAGSGSVCVSGIAAGQSTGAPSTIWGNPISAAYSGTNHNFAGGIAYTISSGTTTTSPSWGGITPAQGGCACEAACWLPGIVPAPAAQVVYGASYYSGSGTASTAGTYGSTCTATPGTVGLGAIYCSPEVSGTAVQTGTYVPSVITFSQQVGSGGTLTLGSSGVFALTGGTQQLAGTWPSVTGGTLISGGTGWGAGTLLTGSGTGQIGGGSVITPNYYAPIQGTVLSSGSYGPGNATTGLFVAPTSSQMLLGQGCGVGGTSIQGNWNANNLTNALVDNGVIWGASSSGTGTDVGANWNTTPGTGAVAQNITWTYLGNSFTGALSTSNTGDTLVPVGSVLSTAGTYSFAGVTYTPSASGWKPPYVSSLGSGTASQQLAVKYGVAFGAPASAPPLLGTWAGLMQAHAPPTSPQHPAYQPAIIQAEPPARWTSPATGPRRPEARPVSPECNPGQAAIIQRHAASRWKRVLFPRLRRNHQP